jgi:hypothetical protein
MLAGAQGKDARAPAGEDYYTLAEDYGIEDEAAVEDALAALHVSHEHESGLGCEVHYRPDDSTRPIAVHAWTDVARVKEECSEAVEVRSPPASVVERLAQTQAVVGIELGFSQLEDMGVVLAYELARWIAQRGDGVIVDDDDRWMSVSQGAWVDL